MILLITVPHTGTHFMRNELLVDHETYVEHTWAKSIDTILSMIQKHDKLVSPMRHPMQVAQSWKSRQKPLNMMYGHWERFFDYIMPNDPFILPIDVPQRNSWLTDLNNLYDLELKTTWPIVREGERFEDVALTKSERDRVEELLEEHRTFFGEFGYS